MSCPHGVWHEEDCEVCIRDNEIANLKAERGRYRKALEEMAGGCSKWQGGECRKLLDDHNTWCCACIAADALEGK